MEQLAEDMRLLGLPYLLGKAAGVAADFEAQGSDGTALAFVEAIIAIKDTLKHPELAGLDAACASMGTSEICRPGVASESQYILSDRAETCDESQNGHLSSKLSQPPGMDPEMPVENPEDSLPALSPDSSLNSLQRTDSSSSMASATSHPLFSLQRGSPSRQVSSPGISADRLCPEVTDSFAQLSIDGPHSQDPDLDAVASKSCLFPGDCRPATPEKRARSEGQAALPNDVEGFKSPMGSTSQLSSDSTPSSLHSFPPDASDGNSEHLSEEEAFQPSERGAAPQSSAPPTPVGPGSISRSFTTAWTSDATSPSAAVLQRVRATADSSILMANISTSEPAARKSPQAFLPQEEQEPLQPVQPWLPSLVPGETSDGTILSPGSGNLASVPVSSGNPGEKQILEQAADLAHETPALGRGEARTNAEQNVGMRQAPASLLREEEAWEECEEHAASSFCTASATLLEPVSSELEGSTRAAAGVSSRIGNTGSPVSDADSSPIIAQSTLRKPQRRVMLSDDEEDRPSNTDNQPFLTAITCFDNTFSAASALQASSDTTKDIRKSATEGVSQQRDSKAEGGTDVTRPRGLTHLSIESTNPGIEQENSDRSSSVIDLSSDSDGNDCELLTEDRRDTDSRSLLSNIAIVESSDSDDGICEVQPKTPPPPINLSTPAKRKTQGGKAGFSTSGRPNVVPSTPLTHAAFKRKRVDMAADLFQEFNGRVFGSKLPQDLAITWNKNLSTTAGLTYYERKLVYGEDAPRYLARIELSTKVLDNYDKLRSTVLHEMCHAAAWLLDHKAKPPHGPHFKQWAVRAMKSYPDLEVSTCHTFAIHYPFQWQCLNAKCGKIWKRHSRSIDTAKKVCGTCHSQLVFLGRFNADGTPAAKRDPSQFSLFVKSKFSAIKQQHPKGTPHGDIMKTLARQWHEEKGKSGNCEASLEERTPMRQLNMEEIALL